MSATLFPGERVELPRAPLRVLTVLPVESDHLIARDVRRGVDFGWLTLLLAGIAALCSVVAMVCAAYVAYVVHNVINAMQAAGFGS
jgi:hypothetical protein